MYIVTIHFDVIIFSLLSTNYFCYPLVDGQTNWFVEITNNHMDKKEYKSIAKKNYKIFELFFGQF
jgi:hypothetical protein